MSNEQGTLTRTPRKVQLGLGLPPHTLARLDRLRACTGLTRGDVVDAALNAGGLAELENTHASLIRRFNALAARAGQDWETYAHEYAKAWASKTYPPTVEALEEVANAKVEALKDPVRPVRKTLRDMT